MMGSFTHAPPHILEAETAPGVLAHVHSLMLSPSINLSSRRNINDFLAMTALRTVFDGQQLLYWCLQVWRQMKNVWLQEVR